MTKGNPETGLLRAMLRIVHRWGAKRSFYSTDLARTLEEEGFWKGRRVDTPARTVNMYCSQNNDYFDHIGNDEYRLRSSLWGKSFAELTEARPIR